MMSELENAVGEIERSFTEANILWKIPHYLSLSQKANTFYESPFFEFLGSAWCLRIYPNGKRLNNSVHFVVLGVRKKPHDESESHQNENRLVSLEIGIIRGNDLIGKQRGCYNFEEQQLVEWKTRIERSYLIHHGEITPGGILAVKFVGKTLPALIDTASQTRILDGIRVLTQDFQALLNSEEKYDVEINVQNQVFRVHKLILGARSTVFKSMFEKGMQAKNTDVLNIIDCDPSAFQDLLLFIYTGEIESSSLDNITGLYSLAKKYDLSDLKMVCVDYMNENLRLDTVCSVLAAADKFSEAELKKSALELFVENLKTITSTENWINFVKGNPELVTEILLMLHSSIHKDKTEVNIAENPLASHSSTPEMSSEYSQSDFFDGMHLGRI